MNQHLQNIIKRIEQDERFTAEEKAGLIKSVKEADKELEITAFKLDRTEKVKRTTAVLLEETIAELEQKRKAVEEQNRELEIESAVERVRAKALAMHKSEEILGVVVAMQRELIGLNISGVTAATIYLKEDNGSIRTWDFTTINESGNDFQLRMDFLFRLEETEPGLWIRRIWNSKEKYLIVEQDEKDHVRLVKFLRKFNEQAADNVGQLIKEHNIKHSWHPTVQLTHGKLNVDFIEPPPAEMEFVLPKMGAAFDLAYKRFLDLKNAEEQTKEAKIELALERVRARTMAMQKSDELREAVLVIYQQLQELDFGSQACNIIIIDKDTGDEQFWVSGFTQEIFPESYHVPRLNHHYQEDQFTAWRNGVKYAVFEYTGKEKKNFDKIFFTQTDFRNIPEQAKQFMVGLESIKLSTAFITYGSLQIIGPEPLSEEKATILKRFAKVFEQTYTRFLDLQKAEVQAREAMIEAALERVRSRTMAMHKTDELLEAAELVGRELAALGVTSMNVSYAFVDDDEKNASYYSVNPVDGKILSFPFVFPHTETNVMRSILSSWKKQEPFNMIELDEKATLKHQTWVGEHIQNLIIKNNSGIPFSIEAFLTVSPKKAVIYTFNFKQGYLFNIGGERLTNAQEELVLRFTKVFEMTYRRFLDLKQAEEQTREAQIELGLERVRARAMAMQNSDELKELIGTVFTELTKLDLVLTRCVIMIFDGQENNSRWWMANSEDPNNPAGFFIKRHEHPPNVAYFKAWRERKIKYTYALQGKVKQDWDEFLFSETELKNLPGFVIEGMKAPDLVYLNASFNNFGNLTLASLAPLSDEHFDILLRFAKVFDLTYTRFNDLQKAEAQAREAQIELGLERVRARAMAMQKSGELSELVDTVFKELTKLDFAINMCIINIIDESTLSNIVWGANPDTGKPPESYYMKFEDYPFHHAMMKGYQERASKFIYVIEGEEKKIYDEYLFNETEFSKMPLEAQAASKALKKYVASFTFSNFGGLQTVASEDMSDEKLDILARFGKVFDLTYTRFNDLKQAETQAREAQIEAALERVRSRSLAMHKSDELRDVVKVVFKNLEELKFAIDGAAFIGIPIEGTKDVNIWIGDNHAEYPNCFRTPFYDAPHITDMWKAMESGLDFYSRTYNKKEKNAGFRYAFEHTDYKYLPDQLKKWILEQEYLTQSFAIAKNSSIGIHYHTKRVLADDEIDILKRFSKVFDQAYIRFLDLQKSEAQTKEAQIEAALERVRSRSMAMHRSDDLHEVIKVVTEQLSLLDLKFNVANFAKIDSDNSWDLWLSTPEQTYPALIHVPYLDHPIFNWITEAVAKGNDFSSDVYSREETNIFFHHFFENTIAKNTPEERKQFVYNSSGFARSLFLTKNIWFSVVRYSTTPFIDEENAIFKRFANVFEQAYTRFLDLQKAEAQAKEARIEAALEKVRSRSLAMHKSEELQEVVTTVFERLNDLDIQTDAINLDVFHENKKDAYLWTAVPGHQYSKEIHIPYNEATIFKDIYEGMISGKEIHSKVYSRELKDEFLNYIFEHSDFRHMPKERKEMLFATDGSTVSVAYAKNTAIIAQRYRKDAFSDDDNEILKRFAKVFEQAYTRFLDLQKAEAQARESQIQLALERVRARTMAMQKSAELTDVAGLLFEQVSALGIKTWTAGFNVWSEDNNSYVDYITSPQGGFIEPYTVYTETAEALTDISNARKSGVEFDVQYVEGEKIKKLYLALTKLDEKQYEKMLQDGVRFPSHQYEHFVFGSKVSLMFITYEPVPEAHGIFKRLGKVFEQTYTRFLDLQKSEAQARESQIQLALERVRARTMAMQKSDELMETAVVLFDQLKQLGEHIERTIIGVVNEEEAVVDFWATRPDGSQMDKMLKFPFDEPIVMQKVIGAWRQQKKSILIDLQGEELENYFQFMKGRSAKLKRENFGERRVESFAFFSKGILGVISVDPKTPANIGLYERFAAVFDQTYTRFLDLQKAEAQAREAQIETGLERVRSKTMAMHKSEEVTGIAVSLNEELIKLGFEGGSTIIIIDKETGDTEQWTGFSEDKTLKSCYVPCFKHPYHDALLDAWKKEEKSLVYIVAGKEKETVDEHYFATGYKHFPESDKKWMREMESVTFSHAFMKYGAIHWGPDHLTEDQLNILQRFSKVFEQSYTRFLDLQKAEAQTKEAKIEAALEKVRSRSMAMHSPEELKGVALELRNQLGLLEQPELEVCAIQLYEESPDYFVAWGAVRPPGDEGKIIQVQVQFPKKGIKIVDEMMQQYESGAQDYVLVNEGEKVPEWLAVLKECVPEGYEMVIQSLKGRRPEETRAYWSIADFKGGCLLMTTYIPPSDDARKLLRRFANVFGLAYRRFIDLKNAETQKQEAQIELALERVRARTMAMHKSEELAETAQVLFQQLSDLGGIPDRISIGIADETKGVVNFWTTDQQGSHLNYSFSARLNEITTIAKTYQAWKDHKKSLVIDLHGEELKEWIQFAREEMGIVVKDDQIKGRRVHTLAFFSHGWILVSSHEPQSPGTIQILERFASVFNLTYRRFLDLQKAEAQANEARIEIALERIRARALAMHKSDELMEVAKVMREQMALLGQPELEASVVHLYEQDPDHILSWRAFRPTDSHGKIAYGHMSIPKNSCEFVHEWLANFYSELKEYTIELSGTKQEGWYDVMGKLAPDVITAMRQDNSIHDKRYYRFSKFSGGALLMVSKQEPSEEATYLQKRAAVVFDLAYRRFSDLQKTEAQAKEAQIESALEKVRSRSLAMHKSDELQEVVKTVFDRLTELNIEMDSANIAIFKEGRKDFDFWIASNFQNKAISFHIAEDWGFPIIQELINARENNQHFFSRCFSFEEKNDWFNYAFENTDFKNITIDRRKYILESKAYALSIAFSKNTGIQINNYSGKLPSEEEIEILKRFSKVFEQAYVRFLDLQKAEAQAKEAQIEVSLERVRSKAMAMHSSKDLAETIAVFYRELKSLSVIPIRCGVALMDKETRVAELTTMNTTEQGDSIEVIGKIKMSGHHILDDVFKNWLVQKEYHAVLRGNQIKEYYKVLKPQISYPDYSHDDVQFGYYFMFNEGDVYAWTETELSEYDLSIYRRFTSVISLTYKRYKDLKQAEAQARESQIEAALERVRARAMAMHKTEDLNPAVAIVFEELERLDIGVLRCGISILNKETRTGDIWVTSISGQGSAVQVSGGESFDIHPLMQGAFDAWLQQKDFSYLLEGDDLTQYYKAVKAANFQLPESQMLSSEVDHKRQYCFTTFYQAGGLFAFRETEFSEEAKKVMRRFAGVFDLTYKRFRDLQQAEANAREAQIEASLERLRSKTMAMHNSQDVGETVATMFDELVKLGVETVRCGIAIIDASKTMEAWTASSKEDGSVKLIIGQLDMRGHPLFMQVYDAWKNKEPVTTYEMIGEDLKDYFRNINNSPNYPIRYDLESLPYKQSNTAFMFPEGSLFVFSQDPLAAETIQIFKRFAGLFGQTYRRYLDLQKAEANAREAQIEAGLERVRSRTMAMHKSDELAETAVVLFKQMIGLGIEPNRLYIAIINDNSGDLEFWITDENGDKVSSRYIVNIHKNTSIKTMYEGWMEKKKTITIDMQGKELEDWLTYWKQEFNVPFKPGAALKRRVQNIAYFSKGFVAIASPDDQTGTTINLLERFAAVFNLTYTRFNDLQQAEAQAREALIEAGLERVRARTMAMHSSEDVSIATATMFTELEKLGIENFRGGISIIHSNRTQEVWSINNLPEGKTAKAVGAFNMDAHPFWQYMYKEWEAKKDFIHYYLAGQDKEDYIKILNSTQGYLSQAIQFPDVHFQVYYFTEGSVWTNSLQPHKEEEKQVMKKFTSVFSLTFRRYQDLKKAEAQAREATIEAALERVRGKAMAMHNSNDLSVTTSMIITELGKLGIKPIRCGVGIIDKETHKGQLYTARFSPDGDSLSVIGWVLLEGHPILEKIYEKWIAGEDYFPELSGDSRKSYYERLLAGLSVPVPDFKDEQIHYGHFFSFSVGCLYAWSEVKYNDDEIKILKRFASIIDLTFRRFFELQKSEENAREAIKQAALDRIRADIASMRTIDDLDRITPLIWNELTVLGIPFIRCGVFIMDEEQQLIHTFLSTPDGKAIAAFHLPYDTPGNLRNVVSNWQQGKKYIDHWGETEFIQFADILMKQGALISSEQYLKTIPKNGFYLHFLPFLQGMLYVGNTTQLNKDEIELIQHVADAFSTAYARYEDFNKLEAAKQQVENTLTDLKQTQQQLVQSEKMASLGELTAGIAHEIQNPLNFVNNFSDVSSELLDEMVEELAKGNLQSAKEIVEDVKQNLEKINHHGKRADGIVKGMLQHSRSSSGQKEPTDINILADEYLRLAFHGLRAKDKSFNAKFETEFDNSIEKINIIPQDIGRVILNLINNAFYTVSEKKKQNTNGYEPTVTVTTKKENGKIEIKVRDNGNGIPQKVLDKIFQPFFTTKPTGQGTGLGLSLAYDIVTKGHGGELKVETKEGEGSEFIIQLSAT